MTVLMSGMVSIRSLTCEGQVILSTRHMKRRNVIERKDGKESYVAKINNTSSSVNDFLVISMFIQSRTTKQVVQCRRCLIYVEPDFSTSTYLLLSPFM